MDNYDYDNESESYTNKDLENKNQNIKDLTPSDIELEKNILILQNAISLVKSQRLELDKETEIIYKRINYLKQKEKQMKLHCKKQIDYLHKTVEIKKQRLKDEILLEEKRNKNYNNINNNNKKKNNKKRDDF